MKKQFQPYQIFISVSMAGLILTFLYQILSGNGTAVLDWLVLGASDEWELADFFRHIGYASDLQHTYETSTDACFPPLAYLFYHLLYRMNPVPDPATAGADWTAVAQAPYNILFYVFFAVLIVIALYTAILQVTRFTAARAALLTGILCLSFPYFAAFERGNPVLAVVVLLLFATYFMDAEKPLFREIALILIAVAVNIKLYPAIFLLYYLKQKRYPEALRLFLYSALFFFLPFIWTGGLHGLALYLELLLSGHYNADFMREWSSIRGVSYILGARADLADVVSARIGQVAENLFLLLSVWGLFRAKKRWQELFFLSAIMCFYMPTSWVYNTVYLALPLICLLRDETAPTRHTCIYSALFGLIFTIPVWFLHENPGQWVCIMAYLMWAGLLLLREPSD